MRIQNRTGIPVNSHNPEETNPEYKAFLEKYERITKGSNG